MSYWTTHPRLAELRFGSRTLAPAIGSILVLLLAAPLFFNSPMSLFVRLVVCPSALYIANDAFDRRAKGWQLCSLDNRPPRCDNLAAPPGIEKAQPRAYAKKDDLGWLRPRSSG